MFYLSRFVGSGSTLDDAFRPSVDGVKRIIDLRGDPTDPVGHCLLWTPDRQPRSPTRITLGDDLDEPMPRAVSRILENTLGVTLDADRLRSAIVELLLLHGTADHDQSRWNRLTDRSGRHRIWLGELVYDAPAILGASFTETWTTADSDTIDADQDWTEVSGNHFQIVSQKLRSKDPGASPLDGYARAEVDLDSDDHYAQGVCTWLDDLSAWVGPAVRFSPSASTFYLAVAGAHADEEHIFKSTAGTFADLGSNARTLAASTFLIRLEVDGSALHAEFDSGQAGETVIDITDTSFTGNLRVGLFATAHNVAARQTEVDNVEAGDLATPATVTPAAIARSFSIPAASPVGAAVSEPAVISRTVGVNAVTVEGAAVTTPAAIARSIALPASTPAGNAVTTPAATVPTVVIPQVTAFDSGAAGSVTPDQIARTFTLPAATPAGAAAPTVDAIALSFAVNAVTAEGGSVAGPASISLVLAIPQATASAGAIPATVTPDAIARALTLPAVTVEGAGVVTPELIARAFALAQATPQGKASTLPQVVSAVLTIPAVTAEGGAAATPDTVARSFSLDAVTVVGAAVTEPGVVAIIVSIPQATGVPGVGSGTFQEGGLVVTIQSGGNTSDSSQGVTNVASSFGGLKVGIQE